MENKNQTDPEGVDESSEECTRNSIYFKTQPCFKFMQGRCRFSSCKFAHGIHELRNPSKMPMLGDADHEFHRARYNNNEGSRKDCSVNKGASNSNGCVSLQKQQQGFKRRRVCYQYEATGTCSFGDSCRYPHESPKIVQEGHKDFNAGSYVYPNQSVWKHQTPNGYSVPCPASTSALIDAAHMMDKSKTANAHATSIYKSTEDIDSGNNNVIQVSACQKSLARWKGPQKISRIYGDWIDE
ncbi:zinc finger CCCH domain-containing protein 56 [Cryptomeria japonica]|uniref:zinc finger CCCH domain-containing protein 56 n=1 Tax=Cryptomeria japonica TaxID=3369 RepID=UPI0027DA31E3|nr:zinc finger CCCH domain-containing protein 56 [Cryptomeria japonica]